MPVVTSEEERSYMPMLDVLARIVPDNDYIRR